MRYVFVLIALTLAGVALAPAADACGDKFLVNSKGVNVQSILSATNPGAVVLYRNPESPLAASALDDQLVRDLTAAGHDVSVVTSFEEAQAMLTSSQYDIIVCDIADADRLAEAATDAGTALLPLVDKKAKDDVKAAKTQFGSALKATGKASYMVLQIDESVRKSRKSNS